MEYKFYVYIHTRVTDNTIFYVGKGHGKRAWNVRDRSSYWKHIVAKHNYNVVILQESLTEEQAFMLEKELITDIGKDNLCNMTNGGEGASGLVHSEESRNKMSEARKGKKHTDAHKRKMSEALKGRELSEEHCKKLSKVMVGDTRNKGRKHSEEHRRKNSEAKKGRPAWNKGKKMSPESKAKQKATIARNRLLKQK